jgi:hypothetical protein
MVTTPLLLLLLLLLPLWTTLVTSRSRSQPGFCMQLGPTAAVAGLLLLLLLLKAGWAAGQEDSYRAGHVVGLLMLLLLPLLALLRLPSSTISHGVLLCTCQGFTGSVACGPSMQSTTQQMLLVLQTKSSSSSSRACPQN